MVDKDNTELNNIKFWAKALEEKYPRTDLLSLSDMRLKEMLSSFDCCNRIDSLPTDGAYFLALKSAWSAVRNGYDDRNDVPDAYI